MLPAWINHQSPLPRFTVLPGNELFANSNFCSSLIGSILFAVVLTTLSLSKKSIYKANFRFKGYDSPKLYYFSNLQSIEEGKWNDWPWAYLVLTSISRMSILSISAILANVFKSGCTVLVHHLVTVAGSLPSCWTNHFPCLSISASTVFILLSLTIFIFN